MNTQKQLAVDIRTAAAMISVSPRTIQNYVHARLLPARKIGRRTIISIRALENFLRSDKPSAPYKPQVKDDPVKDDFDAAAIL